MKHLIINRWKYEKINTNNIPQSRIEPTESIPKKYKLIYTQALDRVNRRKLWDILHKPNFPKNLINTLLRLYERFLSHYITIQDVRQDCGVSLNFFNIYIDIRKWIIVIHRLYNNRKMPYKKVSINYICYQINTIYNALFQNWKQWHSQNKNNSR